VQKPHYTKGGKSGKGALTFYFGEKLISGKSADSKLRSRTAEINNGRLAMVGIMVRPIVLAIRLYRRV